MMFPVSNAAPPPRQIDSWQAAEDNAVVWMRHWGFNDAHKTPPGADHGIDVRSSRAIAQVKFEASQVGRQTMQQLVGARGRGQQQLFFFSGAGYARTALEYADMMAIALFKYDLLGRAAPVNRAAHDVVRQSQIRGNVASISDEEFRRLFTNGRPPRPASQARSIQEQFERSSTVFKVAVIVSMLAVIYGAALVLAGVATLNGERIGTGLGSLIVFGPAFTIMGWYKFYWQMRRHH